MLSRGSGLGLILLAVLLAITGTAQSPREARDYFDRGDERYTKGDFEGATALYSQAIQLSLWRRGNEPAQAHNWRAASDLAGESANTDRITFVDPVIAAAYANRGMARYQSGDYHGALADCERAIRINPGLLVVYHNRASSGGPIMSLQPHWLISTT